MTRNFVIVMLLVLNHSFMFGVSEAAWLPDEDHPFGQAAPHEHLHHHAHDREDALDDKRQSHKHSHGGDHQQTGSLTMDDDPQEHHHEHATHVQLNCDLSCSLSLVIQKHLSNALTDYHVAHQSLTWAPPVPPPNH